VWIVERANGAVPEIEKNLQKRLKLKRKIQDLSTKFGTPFLFPNPKFFNCGGTQNTVSDRVGYRDGFGD